MFRYGRSSVIWTNRDRTFNENGFVLSILSSVDWSILKLCSTALCARGTFDDRADKALAEMGDWMKFNSRSIYGCTQAPDEFVAPANTLLTYNAKTNRLYVHLLDYPMKNFLMRGFADKVKYAQFLHDASEIKMGKPYGHWIKQETGENDLTLILPTNKPNIEIPVIELYLN